MAEPSAISVRARAKINLDLLICGRRDDGYHELRTVFQTLAWHDTVTLTHVRGPFDLAGDASKMPLDRTNLAWRAARAIWRTAGRRGALPPARIAIRKRIPAQAGLGGGSSDAAATLVGLNQLFRLGLTRADLAQVGATLGADVAFFLTGGTALGLGRGDEIYQLADLPPRDVVVAWPDMGIATADAYRWFANGPKPRRARATTWTADRLDSWVNDLQAPVEAERPDIRRIRRTLEGCGALVARMSGSGSAVFGLFESKAKVARAAAALGSRGWHVVVTRTLARRRLVM